MTSAEWSLALNQIVSKTVGYLGDGLFVLTITRTSFHLGGSLDSFQVEVVSMTRPVVKE